MNKLLIAAALLMVCGATQAKVIVEKGTKATLRVEYVYTSAGKRVSSSKDNKSNWSARRVVNITATYTADAPQPFGAMHQKDPAQQQMIKTQEAKARELYGQMQPTAGDMMAIVKQCNEDEKCISERVSQYASNMGKPTDTKEKQAAISDLATPGVPRFQLWRSTSQEGSYEINEQSELQVYEMTCTEAKVCKRSVSTKGSGAIPAPPGSRSVAGASMFEVDGWRNDLVLQLPVALQPLPTDTKVDSSIPNDTVKSAKGFAKPLVVNSKPITVKLKAGQLQSSGTETIKIPGEGIDGGTLTVTWLLAAQ